MTTDKIGKAWALLYPHFGVATPQPLMFRYDLGYPIAITKGDHVFLAYLNQWIHLQQTSGVVQEQFSYWILGKTPCAKANAGPLSTMSSTGLNESPTNK